MNDNTVLLSWTQPVVAIWFSVIDNLQLISLGNADQLWYMLSYGNQEVGIKRTCQSDHMLLPTLGYKSHQEFHLGPSLYSLFLSSSHYLLKQRSAATLWAALWQGHIVRNIRYLFAMSFLGAISTASVWGILRFSLANKITPVLLIFFFSKLRPLVTYILKPTWNLLCG